MHFFTTGKGQDGRQRARAHTHEDLRRSKAWDEVRAVSRPFHEALIALFLQDDEDLKKLTFEYGVF